MKESGYVYILTNPSFKEDWVKIGMCSTSVEQRVKQLDSTGVPLPFEIFATMQTSKYKQAEKLIHGFISKFTNLRIRNNREFFNVKPEEALEIFKQVATVLDDAVIDETYMSSMFSGGDDSETKYHKTPSTKTPPRDVVKKWMIPANSKYFDLDGCFNKLGYVYWRQHYNFQTGDIIYIYAASPESAVRYKCIVEGHDLPFSPEMEVEKEFYVNPDNFETSKKHNRYIKLRLQSSTKSDNLSMVHLLENGMNRAPQGCLNLSHHTFAELLAYVEKNF
jgi:hypothetical protein